MSERFKTVKNSHTEDETTGIYFPIFAQGKEINQV